MDKRSRRNWDRIEAEFEEPIKDVIVGLREQGCTWRSIALALEVHYETVKRWRRWLGLPLHTKVVWDDLSRSRYGRG